MRQHHRPVMCFYSNVNLSIVRQNDNTVSESCQTSKQIQFMNKKLQIPNLVWTTMKMSFQQILLCFLFCGLSYAHDGLGQDVLNKPVSLQVAETNLKNVLDLIEKQA